MATGANYPTSFDSYANKVTGDYLTIADVNSRSDAIEALETGPYRPNDGSVSVPAYSFQSDTDTGFFRLSSNVTALVTGGSYALLIGNVPGAVNYIAVNPNTAGSGPTIDVEGTDTNIPLAIDTKGTGTLQLRSGGLVVTQFSGAVSAVNSTIITSASTGVPPRIESAGSDGNISLLLNAKGTGGLLFRVADTPAVDVQRLLSGGGLTLRGEASSSWGSQGANNGSLYLRDNGSGKTQLIVEFNTGGPVVIATEP